MLLRPNEEAPSRRSRRGDGLFAEVGWLQHKITHAADQNLYYRLAQWNLNLGFVFRD